MFNQRTKLYFKYLILRYKANKRVSRKFTQIELEALIFVKAVIRGSSSIITELDGGNSIIKVTKGNVEFKFHKDRLYITDKKSYLDLFVGQLVEQEILHYINRVIKYRVTDFDDKCRKQITTLITSFK